MGTTVHYFLPKGSKPTPEQIEEIRALKDRPITYDEDCPPMTDQKLEELDYLMRKYKTRRITKEIKMKEFPERFKNRNIG